MSHHNVFGDGSPNGRAYEAHGIEWCWTHWTVPRREMTRQDEGELAYGITAHNHAVLLDFGKPIRSLGLEPKEARELAAVLLAKAEEAEKQMSVREAVAGALKQ